jgi:hypothetical protein
VRGAGETSVPTATPDRKPPHILDEVEPVVRHLSVPEVVAEALGLGGPHVDGHMLDGLGMAVVPQQFPSKKRPNRGSFTGCGKEDPLGHMISVHRQVVVSFAPVHLVGSNPDHVVEAQLGMPRFHVGEQHPPHPRAALAEDLASPLRCNRPALPFGWGRNGLDWWL